MMQFRLEKKEATKALVKFHILNSAGELCGSVNVPPAQEADLLKHWRAPQATTAAKPADGKAAIVAALKRGPRLTRQALLRS
jgi:hypothetical protein